MFINKTVDSLTWQLIKRSCTDQSIFDFLVQISSAFTIFLTLALVRMQAIKALEPSTTLLQTSAILNLYHFSRKKSEVFNLLVEIYPIKLDVLEGEG